MKPWPELETLAKRIIVSRHNLSLFYFEAGQQDAPPIILIHGLGDEADSWRHVIPLLATDYRVIAIDLPGFGRSEKPSRRLTAPFLAEVVVEFCNLLHLERPFLVGNSLGAMLSQLLALTYPDRVSGLVLLDGTLVSAGNTLNRIMLMFLTPGLGEYLYNRLRQDPDGAYDTLRPYYADIEALPEADQAFLYQRVNERVWSDGQRRGYFSVLRWLAIWLPRQQSTLPDKLANSHIPTTVVWGEQDVIISIEAAHKLLEYLPAAKLVTIPNCGHLPQQERPTEVAQLIREAISQ